MIFSRGNSLFRRKVFASLLIVSLFVSSLPVTYAGDRIYEGKVIDAETLEPIVGAVVVAIWEEERRHLAGSETRFACARETLTDSEGDWLLMGPEGDEKKGEPYASFLSGRYYLKHPYFIIYKPGYLQRGSAGDFIAYPYVLEQFGLEGIVLIRPGETQSEITMYDRKYSGGFLPFIATTQPELKLRNLRFSFQYSQGVRKVGNGWNWGIRIFWVYTVVGLKEAKTVKERLLATVTIPKDPNVLSHLPLLKNIVERERHECMSELRGKVSE